MKKLKNEVGLLKEALRVGEAYAKQRAVATFEATDSAKSKTQYIYKLLVHDKLIQPLAKGQDTEPNIKHKLALWISRQLPEDHSLLQ